MSLGGSPGRTTPNPPVQAGSPSGTAGVISSSLPSVSTLPENWADCGMGVNRERCTGLQRTSGAPGAIGDIGPYPSSLLSQIGVVTDISTQRTINNVPYRVEEALTLKDDPVGLLKNRKFQ